MGDPHDGRIEGLDLRLNTALERGNDEEVKDLLAEIGQAELDGRLPGRRIRPAPANADASQIAQASPQSM